MKISNATLVAGNTMARGNNTVVSLRYTLENSGSETARVQLVVEPLEGLKSAIYTKNITLFPKSVLADAMPVFMTDSERFLVSLIHRGQRVDKEEFSMKNFYGARALKTALVNDGENSYPVTLFRRNAYLKLKINEDLFRAENVPGHWGFLQDYAMIILIEPDFAALSTPAMMAVRDYVQLGGILYIASPRAALDMTGTVLDDLLPAEPLAITRLTGLESFYKALKMPVPREKTLNEFGEQIVPPLFDYLQAVPREGAAPLLVQAENPLGYVRTFGLGQVVQLTVNPFVIGGLDKKLGTGLWEVLSSSSSLVYDMYLPDEKKNVNQVLQNLQGYKIPSVQFVMKIFWFYVLVGMGMLILLLKKKKVMLAWGCFCIFGGCMTVLIFYRSQHVAKDQPERMVTAVSASAGMTQAAGGPLQAVGNLISKKDSRPDVSSEISSVGYFPQKTKWSEEKGETALAASPLRIQQDEKTISLPKVALQQLRPRTLCWTCASMDYGQRKLALPQLLLGGRKAEFVPWKYSGKMNRAMLLLPGEIRNLGIEGDMIVDRGTSQIEADVVLGQARNYLRSMNLQAPALAILQVRGAGDKSCLEVREKDEVYANYDYHFELIPLDIRLKNPAASKIWYGTDMMRQEIPARADTRQFFREGVWQEVMNQASVTSDIMLVFGFLPRFRIVEPEIIRVYLDIVNPSGRCQFSPVLVLEGGKELASTARRGKCFEFTGDELGQALDPLTGKFRVRIKVSSQEEDMETVQRMNHWKILQFQTEVQGKLADPAAKDD